MGQRMGVAKRRHLPASVAQMERATKAIQYFSVARRDIACRRPRMTSAVPVVSINTDFARAFSVSRWYLERLNGAVNCRII